MEGDSAAAALMMQIHGAKQSETGPSSPPSSPEAQLAGASPRCPVVAETASSSPTSGVLTAVP
eukprot:COSAG01_NODE_39782_length_472_cov_0.833780_1_plen_62_part_10